MLQRNEFDANLKVAAAWKVKKACYIEDLSCDVGVCERSMREFSRKEARTQGVGPTLRAGEMLSNELRAATAILTQDCTSFLKIREFARLISSSLTV